MAIAALLALGCADYPSLGPEICDDGIDDDLDGRTDCADPACDASPVCMAQLGWMDAPTVQRPVMPCPPGWRSIPGGSQEADTCDPYPPAGPLVCPDGQAHFPGDAGCTSIGRDCPTMGEFSADLPSTNVWYVRAGASGNGSLTLPFGDVDSAVIAAGPTHGIIALAAGSYSFSPPSTFVRIRGACAAHTRVYFGGAAMGAAFALEDATYSGPGALQIASGELRGVHVTATSGIGVLVSGPSGRFEADELVVDHVNAMGSGASGFGLITQSIDVHMHRVIISDVNTVGYFHQNESGSVEIEDLFIHDVHATPMTGADGIGMQTSVPTILRHALIARASASALQLLASATIEDVVIRSTGDDPRGIGIALFVAPGGSVRGARVVVDQSRHAGIAIQGTATLSDLVVRGVMADRMGAFGRGLAVVGGHADVAHAWIEASADIGVSCSDAGALHVTDATVLGSHGAGIVSYRSGSVGLERVIVSRSVGLGAMAIGRGSALVAEDVRIDQTSAMPDGTLGYGVVAQDHGYAQIDHGDIAHSASASVLALGTRATLVASDLVASSAPLGIGAFDGTELTLTRFVVDAGSCGVALGSVEVIDVGAGVVHAASIGTCARAPMARIVYEGGGAAVGPSVPAPAAAPLPPALTLH